jgi:hypothetical protein
MYCIFACSNAEMVGSNPIGGMDVYTGVSKLRDWTPHIERRKKSI